MRPNEVIAMLLELAAEVAWPSLRERLARRATALVPDLPILSGHWVASFLDPSPSGPTEVAIDATLEQFGRRIHGVGHIQGRPADAFAFHATIKRNVLFGSFARKDAHVLAGTGTFVLKIAADSKRLVGCCMWYDGLLDGVWESEYLWER